MAKNSIYFDVHFKFYYVNKIIDLIETFVFILRKKSAQVTILHVSHHSLMVLLGNAYFSMAGSECHNRIPMKVERVRRSFPFQVSSQCYR